MSAFTCALALADKPPKVRRAEVLTSRPAKPGDVLTSGGLKGRSVLKCIFCA
jgi:hypothetical protein